MALIPAGYLNAVVSLGTLAESFHHAGTGFLYAHPLPSRQGRTPYRGFLVTNRHVVADGITHVRFNHLETGLTEAPVGAVRVGCVDGSPERRRHSRHPAPAVPVPCRRDGSWRRWECSSAM